MPEQLLPTVLEYANPVPFHQEFHGMTSHDANTPARGMRMHPSTPAGHGTTMHQATTGAQAQRPQMMQQSYPYTVQANRSGMSNGASGPSYEGPGSSIAHLRSLAGNDVYHHEISNMSQEAPPGVYGSAPGQNIQQQPPSGGYGAASGHYIQQQQQMHFSGIPTAGHSIQHQQHVPFAGFPTPGHSIQQQQVPFAGIPTPGHSIQQQQQQAHFAGNPAFVSEGNLKPSAVDKENGNENGTFLSLLVFCLFVYSGSFFLYLTS